MRAGLARGFSVPRAVLDGRDVSIANVAGLDDPEQSAFWKPFEKMPTSIPEAEQEQLRAEARKAIGEQLIRSEEHTSELQSLMRISYAVFCLKKKKHKNTL